MTSDCTLDKEITFGDIKVSVIHKEDQVIYKLADGLKATTVNDKQRQDILSKIRARYIKDSNLLIDDPNEPSILVRVKENRHEKHVNSLEIPLKRSVIEIEDASGEDQHPKQDNAKESSLKATQKYIKKKNKNQKQQLKQNLESREQKNTTLQRHQPQSLQSLFGTTPHALSLVLSSEEQAQNNKEIKKRFSNCLNQDHLAVTHPNNQEPFTCIQDAIDRLLPYHVYHYPMPDLNANKVPLELQDRRSIDIVRAQGCMFEKYNSIKKKINQDDRCTRLLIKKAIATRQKEFLQEELVKIAGNYVQSQQQGAS